MEVGCPFPITQAPPRMTDVTPPPPPRTVEAYNTPAGPQPTKPIFCSAASLYTPQHKDALEGLTPDIRPCTLEEWLTPQPHSKPAQEEEEEEYISAKNRGGWQEKKLQMQLDGAPAPLGCVYSNKTIIVYKTHST